MRIFILHSLLVFFFLFFIQVPAAYTQNCIDNDNDGYGVGPDLSGCSKSTRKPDCNDNDSKIHPRARELCDGIDNNCNGILSSRELDRDGDGVTRCDNDCNDKDSQIYPGAPELCDGKDNDCDRRMLAGERDKDLDGFRICDSVPDCNDLNDSVYPGAEELCDDGRDNNCNGLFDRDDPEAVNCQVVSALSSSVSIAASCTDSDGDGYGVGADLSGCTGSTTVPDCDDADASVNPGAAEVCDGKDTNCDGTRSWNDYDIDEDGFALCSGDCNDLDADVNPDADEICGDGIDNNCNNSADEAGCICPDADGDGHPAAFCGGDDCDDTDPDFFENCPGCTDADGDGFSVEGGSCGPVDCDDTDPAVNPGADEVCDGADTNCDGQRPWNDYDIDEDGYAVCNGDCNDLDTNLNPDAEEICGDGIDNNCNNFIDEAGCTCPDADGDGHPAAFCGGDDCDDTDPDFFENCPGCTDSDGDGFSVEGANCGPVDCDDTDPDVNPGASEVCDGKDTNCDGFQNWNDYDLDGDGYALCNGECDDNNPDINPGMLERTIRDDICSDGIDNDCDLRIDNTDPGCFPPTCDSGPTSKDFPHFFTLLNPDDTVHPDNNSLICGKCHGAGLQDPIRGECQRCHADSSDPSDLLNGTTKDQYPLAPPYGYGTAPNVKMHSSEEVGTKYGNWTMGEQGCSVCHNPHSQEQNNIFGSDYGMFIKEYICYDNDVTGDSVEEFVELTSPTGAGSFADGPPYIENVCEMCHTRTSHHQRDGDAPGGQSHFDSTRCTDCHLHNDGFKPVCNICHEAPPPTGTHLKHFSGTEKQADYGSTLITQDYTSSSSEYIINCGNCHPIDVSRHMNEDLDNRPVFAEIELYNSNAPVGSLKALHPSTASYTPGSSVFTDSSVLELNYTEGTCSDIYCHSGPSVMTTDEIPLPTPDPDTYYPLIYNPPWESLVVKSRQYQSPTWGGAPFSCSGCHEYPIVSECVPEFDPDTEEFIRCTEVSAGAGDSHGWIDPGLIDEPGLLSLHVWNMGFDPLQCNTCHYATVRDYAPWTRDNYSIWFDDISIFNNSRHVNGAKDIQFTDIPVLYGNGAIHNLATATYDSATSTCNDVSCHFNQTEVKWGTPYRWDLIVDDMFIECNICHRN